MEIPTWTPPVPNLSALLAARLDEHGHAPYLTFYDDATGERVELSYATFENWVSKTANLLVEELGLVRGDRVATVLGDHWTTVVVTLACWRAGVCVVPCDADAPVAEARTVVEATGPATAFVREDLVAELDTLLRDTALEDVVVVGRGPGARLTTDLDAVDAAAELLGYAEEVLAFADHYDDPDVTLADDALIAAPPRVARGPGAVRLTQGNVLAAADALRLWGLGPGDRLVCAHAVQTVEGLALAHLTALHAGGSTVLTAGLDPRAFARRVADERATLGLVDPPTLDALAAGPASSLPLRALLVPTGVASEVARRAGERLGVPVHHGQGAAEATCASTLTPADLDEGTRRWLDGHDDRTVGCPTAHAAVVALDPDGRPLDDRRTGVLAAAGPVVSPGYHRRPDLDDTRRTGPWLRTGEVGYREVGPDGREWLFVTPSPTLAS